MGASNFPTLSETDKIQALPIRHPRGICVPMAPFTTAEVQLHFSTLHFVYCWGFTYNTSGLMTKLRAQLYTCLNVDVLGNRGNYSPSTPPYPHRAGINDIHKSSSAWRSSNLPYGCLHKNWYERNVNTFVWFANLYCCT